MGATRTVSATRHIAAPPSAIFELLADPSRHGSFDGSGTVHGPSAASPRLALGSTFRMQMSHVVPYVTRNKVVEFDEGRRIAWHHVARFIWRYELTADVDGTTVTETFDYSVPWGVCIEPLGWPERNRQSMERTLERLDALVTSDDARR